MNLGIFTTIKVKQGIPLFFDKHHKRLLTHAKALKLPRPSAIEKKVTNFLKETTLTDCALRVTITDKGQVSIEHRPIPPTSPISLITVPDTRDKNKIFKTTNRVVNEQAKKLAENSGADDALFVQEDNIIESTICNVFSLNTKGQIITPNLDGKGLNGITRQIIMEQADVIEEDIPETTSGPLVLVNSLRIQQVNILNGEKIADGKVLFEKIKKLIEKTEHEYINSCYATPIVIPANAGI